MRLILDENLPPKIASALREVGKNVVPLSAIAPKGTRDPDWIPLIGAGDIVVTCDDNILKHPTEAAAVRSHAVQLALWPSHLDLWGSFALLVKVLPELERRASGGDRRHLVVSRRGEVSTKR